MDRAREQEINVLSSHRNFWFLAFKTVNEAKNNKKQVLQVIET